jgi:hypothetical protein
MYIATRPLLNRLSPLTPSTPVGLIFPAATASCQNSSVSAFSGESMTASPSSTIPPPLP